MPQDAWEFIASFPSSHVSWGSFHSKRFYCLSATAPQHARAHSHTHAQIICHSIKLLRTTGAQILLKISVTESLQNMYHYTSYESSVFFPWNFLYPHSHFCPGARIEHVVRGVTLYDLASLYHSSLLWLKVPIWWSMAKLSEWTVSFQIFHVLLVSSSPQSSHSYSLLIPSSQNLLSGQRKPSDESSNTLTWLTDSYPRGIKL